MATFFVSVAKRSTQREIDVENSIWHRYAKWMDIMWVSGTEMMTILST